MFLFERVELKRQYLSCNSPLGTTLWSFNEAGTKKTCDFLFITLSDSTKVLKLFIFFPCIPILPVQIFRQHCDKLYSFLMQVLQSSGGVEVFTYLLKYR